MVTLELQPYYNNAESYFYDQQCKYYTCMIRKSTRYYREFNNWLKKEYGAKYFTGPYESSPHGLAFKNEKQRTLFLLRWS